MSEDTVIGFIALGPKLSGDPFYPQDLDLLMTLANQAGIAIKNAQLYTQVVLANEYIENIVRTIESGVVAVDEAGRIAMFNRAAEQLTGLSATQVQDQSVDVLPANLGTLLKSTVADGRERTEPEIQLQADGVTRPVICTTSPLREPTGAVLGAVAVFSDLTPFKQLENERRRAERLAYFEVLASSLAHEIKNPLVAIKTFAQLIPRRHKDEQFVEEFSRVVTREISRMERLVERLRALSRPSDRPKVSLDIREPLAQAVEFLRPAFDEKRIVLGTTFGGEPRVVVGDQPELEQLFINLLMNAHEATPPGGRVSVEVTVSAKATVVHVVDSGPGIPAELLEHVFDPFITSKPRGSGLGLTISAGIATAHRAKLQASNVPGGGALFTVEFPLATQFGPVSEVRDPGMNARA
jgi:PAS domain S-box-containing protein